MKQTTLNLTHYAAGPAKKCPRLPLDPDFSNPVSIRISFLGLAIQDRPLPTNLQSTICLPPHSRALPGGGQDVTLSKGMVVNYLFEPAGLNHFIGFCHTGRATVSPRAA